MPLIIKKDIHIAGSAEAKAKENSHNQIQDCLWFGESWLWVFFSRIFMLHTLYSNTM